MEFRILGPLEIEGPAGEIKLGSGKQRALLALLLLQANDVVPAGRLIELLWPDAPPADAAKALQVHVSRLRRALAQADVIRTRPGGYLLELDAGNFDLPRFEQRAEEARSLLAGGEAEAARQAFGDALALWRGAPLAEFASEPFARPEIGRLEELYLAAVEDRIDADLLLGAHAGLVSELEALVARHPFRERLRAQLMLALYRCGRQADALQAYRDARRALAEELGIEPGRPLQELEQSILRQDAALDVRARDAGLRPGRRAAGLLVGRARELGELLSALEAAAGEDERFALYVEVAAGLRRASAEQPLLVVLDDLDRADELSLLLLEFLAGELAEMHVAILGTYVDGPGVPPALAALVDHTAHHRLRLQPLGVADVARFLELAGADRADAAAVHVETGGNPRLVWQRVR